MIVLSSSFQLHSLSFQSKFAPLHSRKRIVKPPKSQLHEKNTEQNNNNEEEPMLFDPLLSPHSYPSGTVEKPNESKIDDDEWTPFRMKSVKDDFKGASKDQYGVEKSVFTRKWSTTMNSIEDNSSSSSNTGSAKNNNIDDTDFDPLLSPHSYPKGTSAGPIQKKKYQQNQKQARIGVLLIDHGSRRAQSNSHLENVASMYQSRAPSNYVISAAHMEIAKPSIYDGIKSLIEGQNDDGVDVVICHPYFLSPGRHVVEDVPELIDEAMKELQIGKYWDLNDSIDDDERQRNERYKDIKVLCTSHVGSMTDMMIDVIGKMVDETIASEGLLIEPEDDFYASTKSSSSLGGLFGEVQRMLDEQL